VGRTDLPQAHRGGPIRRINHERWLRNVAVALGNALRQASGEEAEKIRAVLRARLDFPSELVHEHVVWALEQNPA